MTQFLLFVAFVILICVLLNNFSKKVGVPVLLAFIILGMVFGNVKFLQLEFDDFNFANDICSAALIFIMFYGGYGTSWKSAKRIATEAGLLASAGVVLTAALTGLFTHFVMGWNWLESLLMGSVVSSTDAASVFSILRSRKLNLKNGLAPLLEVESGSNDPFSNMLTLVMISLIQGTSAGVGSIVWMVIAQILFGAGLGVLIAQGSIFLIRKWNIAESEFAPMFIIGVALFSYTLPAVIGGNGYLSAYIVGIVLGNVQYKDRRKLINFFDGFTGLMQVVIFFMLGLLARPANLLGAVVPALIIFAAMTLIVRPATVFAILSPFNKYRLNQQIFTAFVGLRGASSIVFAIVAAVGCSGMLEHDIFSTVFCIVLLSISLQGSLIPFAAKKLNTLDKSENVMKTFSDFYEEGELQFSQINITSDSVWKGMMIKELKVPKNLLFCQIFHKDGSRDIPDGSTQLKEGDSLILCSKMYNSSEYQLNLTEHPLATQKWIGKCVKDYPRKPGQQLVMIKRKARMNSDGQMECETVIPNGNTVIEEGDTLIINKVF